MFRMPVLINDDEFESLISMSEIVEVIQDFLVKKSLNKTLSPPRFQVDAQAGSLVFTAGGDEIDKQVVGFRVYGTFDSPEADSDANFVSVFDSKTGRLKGLVFGGFLGAKRTAALAAVSLRTLARKNSECLSVIGTGFQAFYQVESALAVHSFKHIKVFSRNEDKRKIFVTEIEKKIWGARSGC